MHKESIRNILGLTHGEQTPGIRVDLVCEGYCSHAIARVHLLRVAVLHPGQLEPVGGTQFRGLLRLIR